MTPPESQPPAGPSGGMSSARAQGTQAGAASRPRPDLLLDRRLVHRVYRLSRRIVGSRDAEDAAQAALVEIVKSAHTLREESRLERWVDRITARTVLRYVMEQRQKCGVVIPLVELDGLPSRASEPSILHQATQRSIDAYLTRLSPAHQEVLVLRYALDYTIDEIADELRRPRGTIKDRLIRARRQLRRLVQRDLQAAAVRREEPA